MIKWIIYNWCAVNMYIPLVFALILPTVALLKDAIEHRRYAREIEQRRRIRCCEALEQQYLPCPYQDKWNCYTQPVLTRDRRHNEQFISKKTRHEDSLVIARRRIQPL